jgi:hypothetical protein
VLFHDLRGKRGRDYRRAQVTEDVIMRIGGWKTDDRAVRGRSGPAPAANGSRRHPRE